MFDNSQLFVIQFCAEECERQQSGEKSVYDMINAWEYATFYSSMYCPPHTADPEPVADHLAPPIEDIGILVEPIANKNGFRMIPIGVGNAYEWHEKADWQEVPRLLELLLDSYNTGILEPSHPLAKTSEDQFYYEFENIHPFRDGNGRTGKILYNYLSGTLENPKMPPNFWGFSNP